jgi:hypothetical protein
LPFICYVHLPSFVAVFKVLSPALAKLLLNPSISFQSGDLSRIPFIHSKCEQKERLVVLVSKAIWYAKQKSNQEEVSEDFINPRHWTGGLKEISDFQSRVLQIERNIDDEIYTLYGISSSNRVLIEEELNSKKLEGLEEENESQKEDDEENAAFAVSAQELAVRWISYAVGIVLGRFQPGVPGALGRAVYQRSDFAIGSLPAPGEAGFDELVGPAGRFAWLDAQGGRHVFSPQVEAALQALAVPDGISVLQAGSRRDLAALALQALELMLGEQQAGEVITAAAGEAASAPIDRLRRFLEKDFFTSWHLKWYRKRPAYWPLQSSRRSYGFVLFHEKVRQDTLYTLQREPYLDTRRSAVALQIADLERELPRLSGAGRKRKEKELDELHKLADELAAFARDLEAVTRGGYEPDDNWIDDGVILRLAPLWPLLPAWKSEPKKHWERLAAGDFDWSHIAMHYWPQRVREKCKTNKSFAIAHGHEEWYGGR